MTPIIPIIGFAILAFAILYQNDKINTLKDVINDIANELNKNQNKE